MAASDFRCIKTYDHSVGLSCVFRQWRAPSHCRLLHGYALKISFEFACHELDERGWVVDFGGLGKLKAWLCEQFDHTVLIAADDPELPVFRDLAARDVIALRVVPRTCCEAFAEQCAAYATELLAEQTAGRVWLASCSVHEHVGNGAVYRPAVAPGTHSA